MNTILLGLIMGWMVEISGYPVPNHLPSVEFKTHSFFVEKVCGGNECPAQGWYDDKGIIYLDERYKAPLSDESYPMEPDLLHAEAVSLIGHEFVHFLQNVDGKFNEKSCENFLAREEEAFRAQRIGMIPYLHYTIPRQPMYRPYKCPNK